MSDYFVRATAGDNSILAFAATTKDLVEEARSRHNTSPVMTAALGRLLTAGVMMGATMKNDTDLMTIKINGDGPGKGLVVTADRKGHVKGYPLEPTVLIHANAKGKLDVAGALGNGVISVIKDIGLKEPYVGDTILISGEIAEDLTYYYATSEQIPSSVALGVLMNRDNTVCSAGGFLIQLMPNTPDTIIDTLEKRLSELPPVTSLLAGFNTPEMILSSVLEGFSPVITEKLPCSFSCNCSKVRVAKALLSIGKKELSEMIDDGKDVDVDCHFCNSRYTFTIEELKALLTKATR